MSFKIRFRIYDLLFYLLLVLSFYFTRNALCRIMMVVFFGYTIFQQYIHKRKTPVPFFTVGFLVFVLYGGINILIGNVINTQLARTMVVSLFLSFLMLYAIVQYIYMKNDIPQVLKITELGIFTTAFVVVVLSWRTITEGRLGGGTEMNSNMLAMLCVYGLVLAMYLRKIGKYTRMGCWFRLVFYTLAVLLTGSRKGVIMIAVAIVVVQMFLGRKKFVKNFLLAVAAIAAIYALIMNVDILYNIIGMRIEKLMELLEEGTTDDGSLNSRQLLIKIGMSYIREKPWTGYGYDCFKLLSGVNADGVVSIGDMGYYSHNNYIELLTGGGIIGFVLYYIPMLYLLASLIKRIKLNICVPYLLAILVSKLAIEFAFVSYYSRMDIYIVSVIVGCVLISNKTKNNGTISKNLKLS